MWRGSFDLFRESSVLREHFNDLKSLFFLIYSLY